MSEFTPRRLQGRWRYGYALDLHTLRSTYLGDDAYGHPQFDTEYSVAGELLHRLKYKRDTSAVRPLIKLALEHLRAWNPQIDLIVSVPPSTPRKIQPVVLLAEALSKKLKVPYLPSAVMKTRKTPALKDITDFDERSKTLQGAFRAQSNLCRDRQILLFDDLYRSGATMNAVAASLYDEGHASTIFAFTITRTRSHR